MLSKHNELHRPLHNTTDYPQDSLHCSRLDPSPFGATGGQNGIQEPLATFTALLAAAQSVGVDTSTAAKAKEANTTSSMTKRRLQNRVSCRKTRLKRKLQHYELEVLVHERQERKKYLAQLSNKLGLNGSENDSSSQSCRETLLREFAMKSLHYALVDPEYTGWLDSAKASHVPDSAVEEKDNANGASCSDPRSSKRLRRTHDSDISSAPVSTENCSVSPQSALFKQWRPLVDGLQNLELKLLRMEENNLSIDVFECLCYWRVVGVRSARVQRDGEIAAIAVSGTTRVRFHRLRVQEVGVSVVCREDNVRCDLSPQCSSHDEHDSGGSSERRPPSPITDQD